MWPVSVSGGSEANNLRLVEAERCMLIRPMCSVVEPGKFLLGWLD